MKRSMWVVILLAGLGLLMYASIANAGLSAAEPTVAVYMPVVMRQATPTPASTATSTATSTPTATPTITRTPTNTATAGITPGAGDFAGTFVMYENKPSYATHIENIRFFETIQNLRSYQVSFGILGVQVAGPDNFFHTSWDGAGAGGYLSINGYCYGPNGMPCAPNADAGRHLDAVIVNTPGGYTLSMFICYSSFTACQTPGGVWQQLGESHPIVAVDWTPGAPVPGATATPVSLNSNEPCRLITNDPHGIYLKCSP